VATLGAWRDSTGGIHHPDDGGWIAGRRVFNLWREPDGTWWFCTARAAFPISSALAAQGRKAFRNYLPKECLMQGEVHAIAQTPDGALWFGSVLGELVRYAQGVFTRFPHAELESRQPHPSSIMKMAADEQGRLWIGTLNGLLQFDGTNCVNICREFGVTEPYADSPEVAPTEACGSAAWVSGNTPRPPRKPPEASCAIGPPRTACRPTSPMHPTWRRTAEDG